MSGAPSRDVVVSATRGEIDSAVELDPATERPARRSSTPSSRSSRRSSSTPTPSGCDALRRRGIDPATVRAVPLSAGVYDYPEEVGRRIGAGARVPPGPREGPRPGPTRSTGSSPTSTSPPARSTRVIDHAPLPVPDEPGNFDDPERVGPAAHHPEADRDHPARGPSASPSRATGVRWESWDLRVGFNEREGLTLHQIGIRRPAGRLPGVDRRDGGALRRPVAGAVLAELLRLRRVHVRPLRRTRSSSAATASARSTTSTP